MAEFLELMEKWDGFVPTRHQVNEAALSHAIDLIMNKGRLSPRRHAAVLEEAITTSDFPYLFGQVIDRQLLANYKAVVADWRSYVRVAPGGIPDFNTVRREKLHGADNHLEYVPEKGEYQPVKPTNCRYSYNLKKYGRQFDISWESLVNDSLGAFSDIPNRFATAAIRTEARIVTDIFASAAGPDINLFGAPIADCGQNVTNLGVLPLTIANLEATLQLMAAQTDPQGEPIGVRGVHLVVPPQLEFTARAIITSALKQWTEVGAGGGIPVPAANVIPQYGVKLHVDPFLPVIDTSATNDTTWYVFADPSQGAAMEVGYLRGYETPEIVMKSSDKMLVGGGLVSPFAGDFASDNVMYRVRMVFGGTAMDPRFAYAHQAP